MATGRFHRLCLAAVCCLAAGTALWTPRAAAGPVGAVENIDAGCLVRGIVAGPDGNIWFTCQEEGPPTFEPESLIGRVTPQGEVTKFKTGLSQPSFIDEIVVGPDGNLWFPIEPGLNTFPPKTAAPGIGRITPQGQITEFREGIGAEAGIGGLVAGPDGNVWFSLNPGSQAKPGAVQPAIGRITPQGTITLASAGLTGGPGGLVLGPDGNIWFGEDGATIARITPTGTITSFRSTTDPRSTSHSGAVVGSDGNLWFFAGRKRTSIARVTPQGVISEFSDPSFTRLSLGPMVAGPDESIWFGERGEGVGIGRITPSGQISEFSHCLHGGIPGAGVEHLAAGPDGNVWFTNLSARHLPSIAYPAGVGWITPSGKITELRGGLALEPGAIVAGADGSMWFADGAAIGRIKPFTAPANTFLISRPRLIGKRLSASLPITVPGPGALRVRQVALVLSSNRRLRLPASLVKATAGSCGATFIRLGLKGKARIRLLRKGQIKLRIKVTFIPAGGTPNSSEKTIVLRRRSGSP